MIAKRKKMLSDLAKGELRAGLTALSGEFVELLVGRLLDSDRSFAPALDPHQAHLGARSML